MKKVRVGVLSPARTFICLHLARYLPALRRGYIGMAMTAMPMITRTAAETASM